MCPSDPPLRVEALLAHEGFLTSLARGLVRDPHLAEDAVQDTYLAALEHSPTEGSGLRPWMSRVLRNRIRKVGGREAARSGRERDASPEPDELAARQASVDPERLESALETRRLVAEAVRDLPEPQRSAVFLRYYEGLEPAAIAEELRAPVATIKSRIRAGLQRIRERLDREYGSEGVWASLLLPALESGRPGPTEQTDPPGSGTPVTWLRSWPPLLGSGLVPILLGAALLLTGTVLPHLLRAENPESVALVPSDLGSMDSSARLDPPDGNGERASDLGPSVGGRPGTPADRTEASTDEAPVSSGPTHEEATFRFEGTLVQPGGGPVSGASIYHRSLVATTDAAGRFSFEQDLWLIDGGRQVTSTWIPLFATAPGYEPAVLPLFTSTFDPRESRHQRVELVFPGPERTIEGLVLDPAGRAGAGWKVAIEDPTPAIPANRVTLRKQSIEQLSAGRDVIVDADGQGRFRIGGLTGRDYRVIAWDPVTLTHVRIPRVAAGTSDLMLQAPRDADLRTVQGIVRTPRGRPVAGVSVRASLLVTDAWEHLSGGRHAEGPKATTQADGRFILPRCTTQSVLVSAQEAGVIVLPIERRTVEAGVSLEEVELEVGLRCEVEFEIQSTGAVPDLLLLFDRHGKQLLLEVPEDDPLHEDLIWWPSLPTEGRKTLRFHASNSATHLVLRNWDREEIARIPIDLTFGTVNHIPW